MWFFQGSSLSRYFALLLIFSRLPPSWRSLDKSHLSFLVKTRISDLAGLPDSTVPLLQEYRSWSSPWRRSLYTSRNVSGTMIKISSAHTYTRHPRLVNSTNRSLTIRHHNKGEVTQLWAFGFYCPLGYGFALVELKNPMTQHVIYPL